MLLNTMSIFRYSHTPTQICLPFHFRGVTRVGVVVPRFEEIDNPVCLPELIHLSS